uniref:Uncharacterized protein n=1 Tax=Anguilla anguilla TaxID=7936 RepID=A0A0E9PUA7_ANGAN
MPPSLPIIVYILMMINLVNIFLTIWFELVSSQRHKTIHILRGNLFIQEDSRWC